MTDLDLTTALYATLSNLPDEAGERVLQIAIDATIAKLVNTDEGTEAETAQLAQLKALAEMAFENNWNDTFEKTQDAIDAWS